MRIRTLVAAAATVLVLSGAGCATQDDGGTTDPSTSASTSLDGAPSTADARGGIPVSSAGVGVVGADDVVVDLYVEPLCPPCAQFETAAAPALTELTAKPGVTVVYHVVSFLEGNHGYSLRAASALAVVADQAPDQYVAFLTALFEHQADAKSGLTSDDDIAAVAREAGVPDQVAAQLGEAGLTFVPFVETTTVDAQEDLADVGGLTTPTVLVDGVRTEADLAPLLAAVNAAR